jgi:hypothetical protein
MACDQLAILGHKAGHGPAELGHAGRDLRDLIRTMGLRVLGVGLEPLKRQLLDALQGDAEEHFGRPIDWAKVAGLVDSAVVDSSGFRGGLPGARYPPGIHPANHCYCVVIFGSGVDSDQGGFPKKSL